MVKNKKGKIRMNFKAFGNPDITIKEAIQITFSLIFQIHCIVLLKFAFVLRKKYDYISVF